MNNKFSENLKKIRKDNNLSQEQLADELGVSRQAISKWESAAAYPEMDKILTLCDRFNFNIDDLLHKDIREIKGEEESKKNINKYVDDFLNFITNTINMFSSMRFKSKYKCIFEQFIIIITLLIIIFILGQIGLGVFSGMRHLLPSKIYYPILSIIKMIYYIFCFIISLIIIIHIFKTRYLDYYESNKKEIKIEKDKDENIKVDKTIKEEEKIIIRDPKHSEYKFINGLFKGIILMIKFFTLCISIVFFLTLISLFILLILSFLISRTGLFYIGLLITIISSSIINIVIILMLLNFVFNRKSDKKKMIWSFIISLVTIGIGIGLLLVGSLQFKYIENDLDSLETKYIELEMKNNLLIENNNEIEYIPSDNTNIKIEYTINKNYNVVFSNYSNIIHLWPNCNNPIELVKEVIENINNRKIIPLEGNINSIKVYTTLENINTLKNNKDNYYNDEIRRQNLINSYERKINELEDTIDNYIKNEYSYQDKIINLENEISMYKNNN